jgi:hypothetical protein
MHPVGCFIRRSTIICTARILAGEQIKNNEMSRREVRMKERDKLENSAVDGAIMKMDLQYMRW